MSIKRGLRTRIVELSGAVVLPALVTTAPAGIVLVWFPNVTGESRTWRPKVTWQDPDAGIVPPVKVTVVPFAGAFTVPPAQVVAGAGLAATVNPLPIVVKSSTTEVTVIGDAVLLVSVTPETYTEPADTVGMLKLALMNFDAVNGVVTVNIALEPT